MLNKKSDEPEKSAEELALEQRVDAMMSTELDKVSSLAADQLATKKSVAAKVDTKIETKVESNDDQKTAPELPDKLAKSLKLNKIPAPKPVKTKTPDPPIVIKLADENAPDPDPIVEPDNQPEPEDNADLTTDDTPSDDQDILDDSETDEAVDDIVAHEGDTILAVNDAVTAHEQRKAVPGRPSGESSRHKWLWLVLVIILIGTAIDVAIFVWG